MGELTKFYGAPHIYPDGNQWCAVWLHHRDLALDPAGFGDTPEAAVNALRHELRFQHNRNHQSLRVDISDFEIGTICRRCHCFVPDGFNKPGCNRDDCPCQPPNRARLIKLPDR